LDVYKETSPTAELKHGRLLVGLSPVPLSMADGNVVLNKMRASRGIMIQNLSDGNVYVGGENVTIQTGFRIGPNNVMTLPIDNPEFLFVVSDDVDREVRWIMC
jgi:hypothetical protein